MEKKNDVTFMRILEGFIHVMVFSVILPQKGGTSTVSLSFIYASFTHCPISLLFFSLRSAVSLLCVWSAAQRLHKTELRISASLILQISRILLQLNWNQTNCVLIDLKFCYYDRFKVGALGLPLCLWSDQGMACYTSLICLSVYLIRFACTFLPLLDSFSRTLFFFNN